jgi:hypothetical protein
MEVRMSTFQIDKVKIIDWLFPETNWDVLDETRYREVLGKLAGIVPLNSEVVEYLKNQKIKIGFHEQYHSGGGWTFLRNITLQPLKPGGDHLEPVRLSLIIHETFHLKQSIWMRLSMQGELRAWQYQKKHYPPIANTSGKQIGEEGEAYPKTQEYWDKLADLSPDSRDDLGAARNLMKHVASGYRSDRLPLYPLPQEIRYYLRQGKIRDAIQVVLNLVRGNS